MFTFAIPNKREVYEVLDQSGVDWWVESETDESLTLGFHSEGAADVARKAIMCTNGFAEFDSAVLNKELEELDDEVLSDERENYSPYLSQDSLEPELDLDFDPTEEDIGEEEEEEE